MLDFTELGVIKMSVSARIEKLENRIFHHQQRIEFENSTDKETKELENCIKINQELLKQALNFEKKIESRDFEKWIHELIVKEIHNA